MQAALEQWEGAWGLTSSLSGGDVPDGAEPEDPVRVRCQAASEAARGAGWPAMRWDVLGGQDQIAGVWGALRSESRAVGPVSDRKIAVSRAPRRVPDELYLALFSEAPMTASGGPRLADDLVQAAWSDWRNRLASLFAADRGVARVAGLSSVDNAPGALSAPWSGPLS